jgi:hypothetical protein
MSYDLAEAAHELLARATDQLDGGAPDAPPSDAVLENLRSAAARIRDLQPDAVWDVEAGPDEASRGDARALLEAAHALIAQTGAAGPWYASVERPRFDELVDQASELVGSATEALPPA